MQQYPTLRLGIASHEAPDGEVPVFYMTGRAFYFVGTAEGTGDADRLGRRSANALATLNETYVLMMLCVMYG